MRKLRRWIVFYQLSGHTIPEYIECVGTGSVLPVDNRLSNASIEFRVTHGYYPIPIAAKAFAICVGERILNLRRQTPIRLLSDKRYTEDLHYE